MCNEPATAVLVTQTEVIMKKNAPDNHRFAVTFHGHLSKRKSKLKGARTFNSSWLKPEVVSLHQQLSELSDFGIFNRSVATKKKC